MPQTSETSARTPALSVDNVTARLKQLAELPESDSIKAKVVPLYEQAIADLKLAAEHQARADEFNRRRIAAPYQLENRKRDFATASAPKTIPSTPPEELEPALEAAQQELAAAQKALTELEAEPQRRAARRMEIPQAIAAARVKLDELAAPAATPPAAGAVPTELEEARTIARQARAMALRAEIDALEKELQSFDATSAELLKLDRDAAARNVSAAEKRVASLREAINERRRSETDRQAFEARWAAAKAEPALQQLAESNRELADERKHLADRIERLGQRMETAEKRLLKIGDEFQRISEKVETAGLTNAIGQMLRKYRSDLSSIDTHRRAIRLRHEEISAVQLRLFDLEDLAAPMRDLDAQTDELYASLPDQSPIEKDDVRTLLKTKKEYLDSLVKDYNAYFNNLIELDSTEQQLVTQSQRLRDYIDERVLWIRSAPSISTSDLGWSLEAAAWLTRPDHWWTALVSLTKEAEHNQVPTTIAGLALLTLLVLQRRLRRATRSHASQLSHDDAHAFRWVRLGQVVLGTSLVAALWPAAMWFVGWQCSAATEEFSKALGHALQSTAPVFLMLAVVRQWCRHGGLIETYTHWPVDAISSLRREVIWLMALGLPLFFGVAMLEGQTNDHWKSSLGRILFVAGQLILAGFMFRVLRPSRGALYRLMASQSGSWLNGFSVLLFAALSFTPIALAALTLSGYYYTSLRLASRLQSTVWLMVGLVAIETILARWLIRSYQRHTQNAEPSTPEEEAHQKLLARANAQTRQLLHSAVVICLVVGLSWVWVDVLPALRIFNQVTLWPDAANNTNITLAHLIQSILIAGATFIAVRNVPGMLEIALLQRLPVDNGVRYAMGAIVRYAIGIVGLALACGALGIGWPKVQWLAAAVTFGLGFGLQEIFANFVSGLIVLFERPIRVGDTVTVGEVTGVVSRIRMRATTIVDWDRKELIVPNREFITGRLVNWTLSDSVIRLVVPVGIAYGSDTEMARQTLLRAAREVPQVLRDPPTQALFLGFGESSLDFELRVFVGHVDQRTTARHQLHMAIDRAFRAAGIEIAFPQRDLHIRSIEPVVAVAQADTAVPMAEANLPSESGNKKSAA